MIYLLLSILCSVTVGILFKTGRRYTIHAGQAVAVNYIVAIMLSYVFLNPDLSSVNSNSPWLLLAGQAVLLPVIFLLLAASVKHMGIVKTDSAQRLSLFIPLLAAWFLFNDTFNTYKIAGIAIALPAILLILVKQDNNTGNKWLYPGAVFLGFGIIDIIFKQIVLTQTLNFTTSLFLVFCGSLIVALLIAIADFYKNNTRLQWVNILFGISIGIFNFCNILFYLLAHKAFANNPSTVFAGMNTGVIVLGSLAGIFIFKEKLSRYNYLGLALAIVAIVFITLSQIYK